MEICALTVIFVIAAFLVYKTTILTRMILPRTETLVEAEEGEACLLADGDHLEQTFRYPSDELLSAGVRISLNEKVQKKLLKEDKKRDLGSLHLEILDEGGQSLMKADYRVSVLADDQNLVASFPGAQTGFEGAILTIALDAETIHEELDLKIGCTGDTVGDTALSINGRSDARTLNIQTADRQFLYWKSWGAAGAVLIYLLLLGTYLGFAVFRGKPENVFLFTGAMLALVYLLLLPPLAVPDEEVHFKQAYDYANRVMGQGGSEDGAFVMDAEDFHAMQMFETTPSLPEYDRLKDAILKSGREEGRVTAPHFDTRAPAVTYVPGILGIVIGRALGLNGLIVIYLGRICAILCYLITMYLFIRLMKAAKAAAFLMAVLPMTIQQCCSYSYDSIVIEFAFVYIALLFSFLYDKRKMTRRYAAAFAALTLLLAMSKGGTYLPLCLLLLFIPADCFKRPQEKKLFLGGMAAAGIVGVLSGTLSNVLFVVRPTAQQTADAYLAGENYGLSGLLSNPMEFVFLSVRTLFLSGAPLLENMIGMQLGWMDINVSRFAVYGFLLLLLLSILQIEDGRRRSRPEVTALQKAAYLAVILISAGVVFASMFISWTPRESTEIFGIQGRYFLPLLPLGVRLCYSPNLTIKKDMGRTFMFAGVCLQCVAIYSILLSLERIL